MSLNNKIQLLQLYNYIDILFDTCDYNNIREFIDDELIEPKNKFSDELIEPKNKFSDELLQYIIRKLIYVKNPKSNELLKYIYSNVLNVDNIINKNINIKKYFKDYLSMLSQFQLIY